MTIGRRSKSLATGILRAHAGAMMNPSSPATHPPQQYALPLILLAIGCLGVSAGWVLLAIYGNAQMGWMTLLAAFDAAWMLKLGRFRPGWSRAAWALAGTALTVLMANWAIAAIQMGIPMGLGPWDALWRPGPSYVWLLADLANSGFDKLCIAVGLAVAVWQGR